MHDELGRYSPLEELLLVVNRVLRNCSMHRYSV